MPLFSFLRPPSFSFTSLRLPSSAGSPVCQRRLGDVQVALRDKHSAGPTFTTQHKRKVTPQQPSAARRPSTPYARTRRLPVYVQKLSLTPAQHLPRLCAPAPPPPRCPPVTLLHYIVFFFRLAGCVGHVSEGCSRLTTPSCCSSQPNNAASHGCLCPRQAPKLSGYFIHQYRHVMH